MPMSPPHGPIPGIGTTCGRHTAIGDRRGDGAHTIGAGDTPITDSVGVGVIPTIITIITITDRPLVPRTDPTTAPPRLNGRHTAPAGGVPVVPAAIPASPGHRAPTATGSSPTRKINGYGWAIPRGRRNGRARPGKSRHNAIITNVTPRATTATHHAEAASAAEAAVRREAA